MIKVGVIGCGSISRQRHVYEYAHNKDVEIVGFYDMYPERAKSLAELFGGKVYDKVDDLIQKAFDEREIVKLTIDKEPSWKC